MRQSKALGGKEMKKSRSKSTKEEVAVTKGMNVRMINRKPVLEQRFTLEEAFTYEGSEDYASDTVKGVLAVSFLLDSLSEIGGKDVDARIAQGLAYALRAIAKNADKFLTESFRLKEAEHALQEAGGREAA
jgi:hypothetical protein